MTDEQEQRTARELHAEWIRNKTSGELHAEWKKDRTAVELHRAMTARTTKTIVFTEPEGTDQND